MSIIQTIGLKRSKSKWRGVRKLQGRDDREEVDRGGDEIVVHLRHRGWNCLLVDFLEIDRDSCLHANAKSALINLEGKPLNRSDSY